MTSFTILWIGLMICGGAVILRQHIYPPDRPRRGIKPGHGDTLAEATGPVDYSEGVVRVPKDPQAYAKGMMPNNRK